MEVLVSQSCGRAKVLNCAKEMSRALRMVARAKGETSGMGSSSWLREEDEVTVANSVSVTVSEAEDDPV